MPPTNRSGTRTVKCQIAIPTMTQTTTLTGHPLWCRRTSGERHLPADAATQLRELDQRVFGPPVEDLGARAHIRVLRRRERHFEGTPTGKRLRFETALVARLPDRGRRAAANVDEHQRRAQAPPPGGGAARGRSPRRRRPQRSGFVAARRPRPATSRRRTLRCVGVDQKQSMRLWSYIAPARVGQRCARSVGAKARPAVTARPSGRGLIRRASPTHVSTATR